MVAGGYDKMCAAGIDTEFGKKSKYLYSGGREDPFYAIIAKFRVLIDKRLPVPRLYGGLIVARGLD